MTEPKYWGADGEFIAAEPATGNLVGVTIITAEWTGTGTLTANDVLVPAAVYYRAGWEAGWAAHSELDRLDRTG